MGGIAGRLSRMSRRRRHHVTWKGVTTSISGKNALRNQKRIEWSFSKGWVKATPSNSRYTRRNDKEGALKATVDAQCSGARWIVDLIKVS